MTMLLVGGGAAWAMRERQRQHDQTSTPVEKATVPSASSATPPQAKKKPKDEKAERIRRIDAEAMLALSRGELREGSTKLLGVAEEYQNVTPDECSAEESLMVAVVLARISALIGKGADEETLRKYVIATELHSRKGGIAPSAYLVWFESILKETAKAAAKK